MDRRSQILEYVIEHERVNVNDLSEIFAVSQVTIRKDLDALEQKGVIERHHGFAVAIAPDNLLSRLAYHYDNKRRIAALAACEVANGSTVMIESGSCCALLAQELAATKRGVTIITNSVFIAEYIRHVHSISTVLLGGDYQQESQVTVGPLVETCLEGFHVEQLFIGIDGYTIDSDFTARNHLRAAVVKAMAKRADKTIVVTESLKFDRQGAVGLLPVSSVHQVITDDMMDPNMTAHLEEAGVKITRVTKS